MANETRPNRAIRFGLEAGAIFLGVTLGFLADDYRDYLNDRSLERESLRQVIDDLRLDHEDMEPMVVQTQSIAETTRWITNRTASGGLSSDSLTMALDSLNSTGVFWYEPVSTAYSGLNRPGFVGGSNGSWSTRSLSFGARSRSCARRPRNRRQA